MNTFPNSPRLIKDALTGVDLFSPLGSVAVFQYNLGTMMQMLEAWSASIEGVKRGATSDRATETVTPNVEINATGEQAGQSEFKC